MYVCIYKCIVAVEVKSFIIKQQSMFGEKKILDIQHLLAQQPSI